MTAMSVRGISLAFGGLLVVALAVAVAQAAAGEPKLPADVPAAIRLFNCDFFGYAWGTPPSFLPTAMYDEELKEVNAAFAEMQKLDAARARNAK